MLNTASVLADLSDRDLVATVARLAARERETTADLLAALAELDARRLYLEDGCASLFTYCTERLRLSESAAYHRITAARAARRLPVILEGLHEGALTLTTVCLLAPHLTATNHLAVLDAARNLGKRAVEELVARLFPRPDVASSIRKLPSPRAAAGDRCAPVRTTDAAHLAAGGLLDRSVPAQADGCPVARAETPPSISPPRRPAVVRPLSPLRYQVQVTVSAETHAKLRRAQDLLRHTIPDGDPAAVFDRALTVLLEQLARKRYAAKAPSTHGKPRESKPRHRARMAAAGPVPTAAAGRSPATADPDTERASARPSTPDRPPRRSRAIPAAVRRAVWARDQGRCTYAGASGRCAERGFLEFHHRVPFAAGGESTVENVAVLCMAHNRRQAERDLPLEAEQAVPLPEQAVARSAAREVLPMSGLATASGGS